MKSQDQKIVVVAEKITTKNGPMYRILDVGATSLHKLPSAYISNKPHVWEARGAIAKTLAEYNIFQYSAKEKAEKTLVINDTIYLREGQILTPEELVEYKKQLTAAGDHLHKILKENRKRNANWGGIETIVI